MHNALPRALSLRGFGRGIAGARGAFGRTRTWYVFRMSDDAPVAAESVRPAWSWPERALAVGLFGSAVMIVGGALLVQGSPALDSRPGVVLFFLLYGLFTISIGYRHPNVGYYSFDRVSQVASILVLGPVDAAWVNGIASLVYPWHRIFRGVPVRDVLFASLFNSGLMASIVLLAGLAYTALGGSVPLLSLGGLTPLLLVGLVLLMQALNDFGMLGLMLAARRSLSGFFQAFSVALELGSGAAAVLVAIVFNSMSSAIFALLLGVLSLGMLALRQFANMRQRLEAVVAERTRSLESKTRELEQLVIRDNLTGLYNRRHAEEFLARQLARDERKGSVSAIALADIDLFKQINDRHSHATGDQVLRQVSSILKARCRKSDMIARFGGEEFLICFPEANAERANAICETLRVAVSGHNWKSFGLRLPVTISFGVAESRNEITADTLLAEADSRLYEAKRGGRNRVVA